jgi:hypothetical protein
VCRSVALGAQLLSVDVLGRVGPGASEEMPCKALYSPLPRWPLGGAPTLQYWTVATWKFPRFSLLKGSCSAVIGVRLAGTRPQEQQRSLEGSTGAMLVRHLDTLISVLES